MLVLVVVCATMIVLLIFVAYESYQAYHARLSKANASPHNKRNAKEKTHGKWHMYKEKIKAYMNPMHMLPTTKSVEYAQKCDERSQTHI